MSDDIDQKLSLDVRALIFINLLEYRCSFCHRHFVHELRNRHCARLQQVSKVWKLGWARAVVMLLRNPVFEICMSPNQCLLNYTRKFPSLPMLLIQDPSNRLHRRRRAEVPEGGEAGLRD